MYKERTFPSENRVKLLREIGADVYINDIDIAHRVSRRDKARSGPKAIVCKFTRPLAMVIINLKSLNCVIT